MGIMLAALLALVMLAAAGYVHKQVARFTRGSARVMLLHALLAAAGVAFGATAGFQASDRLWQAIAFAIGFGVVHLPAAVILLVKAKRGAGKS